MKILYTKDKKIKIAYKCATFKPVNNLTKNFILTIDGNEIKAVYDKTNYSAYILYNKFWNILQPLKSSKTIKYEKLELYTKGHLKHLFGQEI